MSVWLQGLTSKRLYCLNHSGALLAFVSVCYMCSLPEPFCFMKNSESAQIWMKVNNAFNANTNQRMFSWYHRCSISLTFNWDNGQHTFKACLAGSLKTVGQNDYWHVYIHLKQLHASTGKGVLAQGLKTFSKLPKLSQGILRNTKLFPTFLKTILQPTGWGPPPL